jgi:glutamate/aspartate transport system permease protein
MNYNWNWALFFETVTDSDSTWMDMLVSGLGWTIVTALCAWVIAFVVGSFMGVARTTTQPALVWLGNIYVELFRNVPLIVQFFIWYFVLPELIPPMKSWAIEMDPTQFQFIVAVICLGLFTAARVAEQVKSGIQSLPGGQRAAGYALGLTQPQTYRYVLLPMAYRIIVPPLTSEMMNLIKNTSVALTIGLTELTFRTREMGEVTFAYFEAYIAATLTYVVVAMTVNRLMAWVERSTVVPGYIAGGK